MSSPVRYLRGVRTELARVSWPKRDEVFKLTALVITISVIVALYTGGLDLLFTKLVELIIAS